MYCSPNIVRVIKSRALRRAGLVARMEEGRRAFEILTGKPEGKEGLVLDGKTILYCIEGSGQHV